jgi:hypothetical protein
MHARHDGVRRIVANGDRFGKEIRRQRFRQYAILRVGTQSHYREPAFAGRSIPQQHPDSPPALHDSCSPQWLRMLASCYTFETERHLRR